MRMLSGRKHWLAMGLALLWSAQGFTTNDARGQVVGDAAYGLPAASYPVSPTAPAVYAMPPGSVPASVTLADCTSCESGGECTSGACHHGDGSCSRCSGGRAGGHHHTIFDGLPGRMGGWGGYCGYCGGVGCPACAAGGAYLFGTRLHDLMGLLAPYGEGGPDQQRWFDVYGGTIGLRRNTDFGPFSGTQMDTTTGQFLRETIVSKNGSDPGGVPVLRITDLDMKKVRYGMEWIINIQTGVGSRVETRYFGLNDWTANASVNTIASGSPTLYSVFSNFGTAPPGGFDDTDRSFIHSLEYNSELHSGEVNFRRHWVGLRPWYQGSFLGGVRYIDLDERLTFSATGSEDDTYTFSSLRFFDFNTLTRNQLTGFQLGGDLWIALTPGLYLGGEGKFGIFGNHHEVEAQVVSNSIPGAREFMQDGQTSYMTELVASLVYRLSYSWSVRVAYNFFYLENVALAPENMNARDFNNAIGGGAFTAARAPFIDSDGEIGYTGWSIGGEWMW